MNFLEIRIIGEDEILKGSKSRYTWIFGGILYFFVSWQCITVLIYPFYFQVLKASLIL